jgi:hypothetical protein
MVTRDPLPEQQNFCLICIGFHVNMCQLYIFPTVLISCSEICKLFSINSMRSFLNLTLHFSLKSNVVDSSANRTAIKRYIICHFHQSKILYMSVFSVVCFMVLLVAISELDNTAIYEIFTAVTRKNAVRRFLVSANLVPS